MTSTLLFSAPSPHGLTVPLVEHPLPSSVCRCGDTHTECRLCGYPGTDLCQQCTDWQPIAEAAEAAIEYAKEQREAEK